MTRTDTNTILYKENGTTIDLNSAQQLEQGQDVTRRISDTEEPEGPQPDDPSEDTDGSSEDAETKINQSNYLRYLSELRKADSELALAKAESAELVRLMDSYREHYTQYEALVKNQVQENNAAVDEKLKSLKSQRSSVEFDRGKHQAVLRRRAQEAERGNTCPARLQ